MTPRYRRKGLTKIIGFMYDIITQQKKKDDFEFWAIHMLTEWLEDPKKRLRIIQKARKLHMKYFLAIPLDELTNDFKPEHIEYLKNYFNHLFGMFIQRLKIACDTYDKESKAQ